MGNQHLNLLVLAAALILQVMAPGADALSMGSLAKSSSASVNPGGAASFTLLFWNTGDEPYDVELRADYVPDGWVAIISPGDFELNSTPSGKPEYLYLPYLKKSIAAKAVEIHVPVPENAAGGTYPLSVVALARSQDGGTKVGLVGEQKFAFEISVSGQKHTGPDAAVDRVIIENPGIVETMIQDSSARRVIVDNPGTSATFAPEDAGDETESGASGRMPFFAAAAAILVIAWVIYRYE